MDGKSSFKRFETEISTIAPLSRSPYLRCSPNRGSTDTVLPYRTHRSCHDNGKMNGGFARFGVCEKCIEITGSDGGMSLDDFCRTTEINEIGHRGVYSSTAAAVCSWG